MNAPSSQLNPRGRICPDAVRTHNSRFATFLQEHYQMSLAVWKAVKSGVDLGAIILAIYAMQLGAEPVVAIVAAVIIIQGPEILEYLAVREDYVEFEEHKHAMENDSED